MTNPKHDDNADLRVTVALEVLKLYPFQFNVKHEPQTAALIVTATEVVHDYLKGETA